MNEINKFIEFIGKQFINEPIDRHDLSRVEYHRQFMRDINDFYYMYEEEKKKEREEKMGELTDPVEKYDNYCKQKIIEELERIKAEVCEPNEMEYFENSNVWQKWFCDLIDKHIKELKGENNES